MLITSSKFPSKDATRNNLYKSKFFIQFWPFFILILVSTSHIFVKAKKVTTKNSSNIPTHYNFLRGRHRVFTCANDSNLCLDPEKNPWGGTTCCFQKFCKDTRSDPRNCGECGRTCAFGLICCDGKCVDIQNDSQHCGACFEECSGQNRCSFAMCDYGG
ncbi:hypothetical protein ACH5RR_031099 [Cinchona calisaya]|uniref:Uncharacterized protein n=1 Tax=Cinchona calisaya TaxID=153742 RepID=A0ABD2YH82_9GENT